MIDKFEKLEDEKRDKILAAVLKTFADKGYKDASTNTMVKAADISKGTLFYYFKNKETLYYYLIDYSLDIIKKEYIDKIDYTTSDFIQRMENNSKLKYIYYQKYPEVNRFLSTVLYSELNQLPDKYQEKFHTLLEDSMNKINENQNIHKDLFKEGINPEKASRIIELSIEGYFNELAENFKKNRGSDMDLESLWEDFDCYLDTLREVFYK